MAKEQAGNTAMLGRDSEPQWQPLAWQEPPGAYRCRLATTGSSPSVRLQQFQQLPRRGVHPRRRPLQPLQQAPGHRHRRLHRAAEQRLAVLRDQQHGKRSGCPGCPTPLPARPRRPRRTGHAGAPRPGPRSARAIRGTRRTIRHTGNRRGAMRRGAWWWCRWTWPPSCQRRRRPSPRGPPPPSAPGPAPWTSCATVRFVLPAGGKVIFRHEHVDGQNLPAAGSRRGRSQRPGPLEQVGTGTPRSARVTCSSAHRARRSCRRWIVQVIWSVASRAGLPTCRPTPNTCLASAATDADQPHAAAAGHRPLGRSALPG